MCQDHGGKAFRWSSFLGAKMSIIVDLNDAGLVRH